MSMPIQPYGRSTPSTYSPSPGIRVLDVVRQRGVYGMVVAVVAMSLGLSPMVFLVWWNWVRLTSVPIADARVQVKDRQMARDAEQEKPGATALLHVTCEVWQPGGWREMLQVEDDARLGPDSSNPPFVRDERVYLRPANRKDWPFALLGEPPVSAWLPAGEYEVLVVYKGDRGFFNSESGRPTPYPLASEQVVEELPAGRRTVVRVRLHHHQQCLDNSLDVRLHGADKDRPGSELGRAEIEPLLAAIEKAKCLPTPCGVLMDLAEPAVHHCERHAHCEVDLQELVGARREWTRGQIQTLLYWLPPQATAARSRLEQLDSSLGWREFLEGWYCYAAAGVAGLVFARWATIARLSPYRSRRELVESLKLLGAIFALGVLLWIVVSAVSDGI